MELAGIRQIIGDVFGPNTKTEVIGGWVSMHCPLARWKHPGGVDSRPSSGISINNTGTSVFNCYSCHTKVPLQALLRQYSDFTGEDLDGLIEELEDESYLGPRSLPEWGANRGAELQAPEVLNAELYLDLYDSAAGHPYLTKRGISRRTAELLQLKFDPSDSEKEPRILFPVFGYDGALHGFSGRAINKSARLKVRDYAGLRKAYCLLGAHLFAREPRPTKMLVMEGLVDYARAWEAGYPAVSVMHSTFTDAQALIARDIGLPAYLFYDNDDAGQRGAAKAAELLRPYQPVNRVQYPEIWIEDPDEDDGGHWLKDPGDMLPEDFELMIANATLD